MGSSIAIPRPAIPSLLVVSCRVHAASARGFSPFRGKPICVCLFHVICNIVEPVRLMVKPDTHNPPAAVRSYCRKIITINARVPRIAINTALVEGNAPPVVPAYPSHRKSLRLPLYESPLSGTIRQPRLAFDIESTTPSEEATGMGHPPSAAMAGSMVPGKFETKCSAYSAAIRATRWLASEQFCPELRRGC
jgi:hypothetical protein